MKHWKIILICIPISLAIVGIIAGIGTAMNKSNKKKKTTKDTTTTTEDTTNVDPVIPKYSVSVVNNSGFEITGTGSYVEGTNVTLTATNYVPGYFLTWSINNEVKEVGSSYSLTVEKSNIEITLNAVSYNYLYFRTESNIYFGTYPQKEVEEDKILDELDEAYPFDANTWTDYGYYFNGEVDSYMFYKDVDTNNDGFNDFRGVYFTKYRPNDTTEDSGNNPWGYKPNNVYWFSYEPIKWNIVTEDGSKALLWASLHIDSQEFYSSKQTDEFEHNGGVGYANNYELSNIRKWLNDNFYNTAFNALQKELIIKTTVDNSINQVYKGDEEFYPRDEFQNYDSIGNYICNNTEDNVFLLSFRELFDYYDKDHTGGIGGRFLRTTPTDYAKSQRLQKDKDSLSVAWLRTPGNVSNMANFIGEQGGLISGNYHAPYRRNVTGITEGIRPALWITLKDTYKNVTVSNTDTEKGTININGEFDAPVGYCLNLIATPTFGYEFDGWYINDSTEAVSKDKNYKIDITDDVKIEAKWIAIKYSLSVVNKSDYDFEYDHGGEYDYKENVTLHFNVPAGYYTELYDEKGTLLNVVDNEYSFAMGGNNIEYSVYFKLIQYKIIYDIPFGVVNPNPTRHTIEDAAITLQDPEAHSEYTFVDWYIDETKVKEIPGGVIGDINVYGEFTSNKYTVSIVNNTNGLEIAGEGEYNYNSFVRIEIINNTDKTRGLYFDVDGMVFTDDKYEFYMPNRNVNITVYDCVKQDYYYGKSQDINDTFHDRDIFYFGEYPQSYVVDRDLVRELKSQISEIPTKENANGWTDYNFYEAGTVQSYMWYIDIDLDGDSKYDYRAVYFTKLRPSHLDWTSSMMESEYETNEIHFFKFDKIAWRKVEESSTGVMGFVAYLCLDEMHFDTDNTTRNRNYNASTIRQFLINDFYNTAFSSKIKDILTDCIGTDPVSLVYNKSEAEDYFIRNEHTEYFQTRMTDYARCMHPENPSADIANEGKGAYFVRYTNTDTRSYIILDSTSTERNYKDVNKWTVSGVRPMIRIKRSDFNQYLLVRTEKNIDEGGTITPTNTYLYNDEITLTAVENENYKFYGWYDGDTRVSTELSYTFTVKKSIALKAMFYRKYNIHYESVELPEPIVNNNPTFFTEKDSFSLMNASSNGYTFKGWYNNQDEKVTSIKGSDYSADITLTAHWEVRTYSISFSYVSLGGTDYYLHNGITNKNRKSYTIEDETFDLIDPLHDYYDFLGWYIGDEKIEQIEQGTYGSLEIKGKFMPKKFMVNIHYNETGFVVINGDMEHEYHSDVTLSVDDPSGEYIYHFEAVINGVTRRNVAYSFVIPEINGVIDVYVSKMLYKDYEEKISVERNIANDLYYGEYPQSKVEDETLINSLKTEAGLNPTEAGAAGWIDYGFYANGSVQSYMWYKDITHEGNKYRAVYFTKHRPASLDQDFSDNMVSDYNINTMYFFKFEPVRWMCIEIKENNVITKKLYTTYFVLDEYQFYNSDVNYPDYDNSALRSYILGEFYDTLTESYDDDLLTNVYNNDKITIFSKTSDISNYLGKTDYMKVVPTDYAKCLRPLTNGVSLEVEGGGTYYISMLHYYDQGDDRIYENVIIHDNATLALYAYISELSVEGVRPVIIFNMPAYSVKLSTNDDDRGSVSENLSYLEGATATVVATPKEGYNFVGWKLNGSIVSKNATYSFTVTENVELEALFGIPHTVTYTNEKGAENLNPKTVTDIETIELKPLELYGWTFNGWEKDGVIVSTISDLDGDIELVANWTINQYSVEVNQKIEGVVLNGLEDLYDYQSNVTITIESHPAGYNYLFRYNEVEQLNSFTFTITENTVIEIEAVPIAYTITYNLDDGTELGTNPESYTVETPTFEFYGLTKTGYEFAGWYESQYFEGDPTTKVKKNSRTGNIVLYAKFNVITYNISYPNCESEDISNPNQATYTVEDNVNLNPASKEYYTFVGWTYEENSTDYIVGNCIVAGTKYGDIKLYAHWTPTDYSVSYILNGGENNPGNPETINCESPEYTLDDPSRLGYEFAGWFTDSDFHDQVTKIPAKYKGTFTVYAKWTAIEYTIDYNEIDGLTITPNQSTFVDKDYIELTVSGLKLGDYVRTIINEKTYTTINLYNKISIWLTDTIMNVADKNHVITLTLEKLAIDYEVTYDNCENATHSNPTTIHASQFPYTLTPATREGYVFIRWEKLNNIVTQIDETCINNFTKIPLTAIWGHNITYEYETGGEIPSEVNDNPSVIAEKDWKILNNLPEDLIDYYKFDGWYLNGEKITEIPMYTTTDITIVAHFIPKKYNITIDNQTGVSDSILAINGDLEVTHSTLTTLSTDYRITGKTLKWVVEGYDEPFTGYSCEFIMPTHNITVTITLLPPYERNGNKIYFGTYPQTLITDDTLTSELNALAETKPTETNKYNWTDYNYYISSNITSYMFYQDIDYDKDGNYDYRGVYFTNYRPYSTSRNSSTDDTYQNNNGYSTYTAYWFKYEKIEWNILKTESGKAMLIANLLLDSQDYYPSTSESQYSHNGGSGYSNNYSLSNIRKWLNDNFYNTAFNSLEKEIIQTTTVDNSVSTTGSSTNSYACGSTSDNVFLLSYKDITTYYENESDRIVGGTDYAKAQGLYSNGSGYSYWRLRSPQNNDAADSKNVFIDGSIGHGWVCDTYIGTRPALWITL